MKEMIVAYGQNREIGRKNDMPWGRDLPADLARFKQLTLGKTVIMGYNTLLSMGSRPLPRRENIVVTSHEISDERLVIARNLDEAYQLASAKPIVIGGAKLYEAALASTDIIYATEVQEEFAGSDTFFPQLPKGEYIARHDGDGPLDETNKYPTCYVTYERVQK